MLNFKNGALIAIAAGSLFAAACKKDEKKDTAPASEMKPATEAKPGETAPAAAAPATPDEKTAKVACMGINECKGHGGCKTEANGCHGQNGCKGKGFVEATEADCKTKGGTVMAKK